MVPMLWQMHGTNERRSLFFQIFGISLQFILLKRSAKIETLSKWLDFYIIWKPLMTEFQNGLIFKVWQGDSGDIWMLVLQKTGFFRQDQKRKKKRFLKGFFFNFLGINTHNFVKNDPKFENKSFFDAECYGGWHEKVFRSQSSKIRGLVSKN